MNNIRQITNFDIPPSAPTIDKEITIGGDKGQTITYPYREITAALLGSGNVFKFGYCANNNQGMAYPIFLTLNNEEKEFQLGKTGMFEFQPEEWQDVNDEEPVTQTAEVYLSAVLVPSDIPFVIDYCYAI